MKATDFDFSKDLKLSIETGIASFRSTRLAMFDVEAIGLLRKLLIDELGMERARQLFLRFGYQCGYADFIQMKINYTFETEMDLLASGPVIHTWEGIVRATPTEIRFNRDTGEFYFTGVWANSYEAEQHIAFCGHSKEVSCWSLMGYASGWCSAFFGSKLVAIEPVCACKGDANCGWEIKPEGEWGDIAKPYIEAFKIFS
ncbi:MAG: XylR N-terminal domain-containing protein [Bacteroidia bacterium]|nr:XylR N-terminal domain-containing protein [Bacteroidia bacterium]